MCLLILINFINNRKQQIPTGGSEIKEKEEGCVRFIFKNWDSILVNGWVRHNVDSLRNMIRQFQADGMGGTEVGVNGARNN